MSFKMVVHYHNHNNLGTAVPQNKAMAKNKPKGAGHEKKHGRGHVGLGWHVQGSVSADW